MSWHCGCKKSTDTEQEWVMINMSFIGGGIPKCIVIHAECFAKVFETLFTDSDIPSEIRIVAKENERFDKIRNAIEEGSAE